MRNWVPLFVAGYFGEWLEYLMEWFTRFHYLAPFIVLLLCGIGAPLPEEITLIGCGYMVHAELVGFVRITIVCSAAILIGDSIPYWLGRHYGLAALKTRWVAKVLHPERFAKIERRFEEHKNWSVFTCRFLPGLRIPGYFVAGTLRMSFTRFLVLDSLGVLLSVPTSIWVASVVFRGIEGEDFGAAGGAVSQMNRYLLIGVAVLVVAFLVWRKVRKDKKRRAERLAVPVPPPGEIGTLVAARRYPEALALAGNVDAYVGALVLESASDVQRLESEAAPDVAALVETRRQALRDELALLHEALLGAGRREDAERLALRALEIDGRAATYLACLRAARRAGALDAARSIADMAAADPRLSTKEQDEVRSAAREALPA